MFSVSPEYFSCINNFSGQKSIYRIPNFALNGIMKCGECKYCVTAEIHTKKYKNGSSQIFAYYRCTKKGNNGCQQPYSPAHQIENQIADNLSLLEVDQEFVDLAYESLEKVIENDVVVTKDSHEALQTAMEGVNRRIDNLIALKISPDNSDNTLLSDSEFADRKRGLLLEKEKIANQISKLSPENSEWAMIARESFEFSLLARERFEEDDVDGKKVVFKEVGSNPILLDQKIQFQLRYLYFKYREGAERMRKEIRPLDPKDNPSEQSNLNFSQKSSLWCPGEESNLHTITGTSS